MRLSLRCDVLYLFEPVFELPAVMLDGNEARVDLVLIQLLFLSGLNHIVLMLTSIFQAQFNKKTKEVL